MNICLCGAQAGYPHSLDCPRTIRATEAQKEAWINNYESIKAKQEATQRILDRRAAAGLLDSDVAAATMTEAQQMISASADAMTRDFSAANDEELFAAD